MASEHPSPAADGELRAAFPCSGADLTAARACELAVFGRRFGNSADELAAQYEPYEECTAFGAVFHTDGTALGSIRLIRPGATRLKTLDDAARPPWSLSDRAVAEVLGEGTAFSHTWDVASFTVDSVAAGADRRIVRAVLSVMFGAYRDNGVTGFVALLDSGARRAFRGLGVRMLDLPGAKPAPYLGSPSSVPVYRRIADLQSEHAVSSPHLHQQVFHGRDIDGLDARQTAPGSFELFAAV